MLPFIEISAILRPMLTRIHNVRLESREGEASMYKYNRGAARDYFNGKVHQYLLPDFHRVRESIS